MVAIAKRRITNGTLLENGAPNSNFSGTTQAALGWTSGGFGQKTRMLFRVDLTDIPSGKLPTAATLTLKNVGSGGALGDGIYYARRVTQAGWIETEATWNNYATATAWTLAGGDYTATGESTVTLASAASDVVFSGAAILALVIDAIQNRSGVLNLIIMQAESVQGAAVLVYTSADTTAANRPTLALTFSDNDVTLTLADNGDGTGAVATIAGSASSATNTVYVGDWGGSVGSVSFASGGSRTGDGNVSLSLTNGFHWAYVVSDAGGGLVSVSNHRYFRTTDDEYAIHYQCGQDTVSRIQSLALSGIDNSSIVHRKLPWQMTGGAGVSLPAVVVSTWNPETIDPRAGTNIRDDVGYPVMVSIVAIDAQDLITNHEQHKLWRERIIRACVNQRFTSIAENPICLVEPASVVLPEAFVKNFHHSSFTLRFVCRQTRGLVA